MAEDFGKQVDLLTMQIEQLANSTKPSGGEAQRRPLPQPNWQSATNTAGGIEWKNKAEAAELKVQQLEEKIQKLAIAVKADREKSKKVIEDWKQQAETADAKTLAYETKLHEAVNLLKKERTKSLHNQSETFLKEQIDKKVNEQVENKTITIREELHKVKQSNSELKSKIDFLSAQLEARQIQTPSKTSLSSSQQEKAEKEGYEQSQKRNKLISLYDYPGGSSEDLTFSEGEVLSLIKKYSDGWWLAEKNGRIGRVPSNFVEELDVSKRVTARSVGEFKAETKKDLSFPANEILFVWKSQDEWWVAEFQGKVGWVPSNFVQEINPGSK